MRYPWQAYPQDTPSPKKEGSALDAYAQDIANLLPAFVQTTVVERDSLTLYVSAEGLEPVLLFLRDHSHARYGSLMELCGADYPTRASRFEVVYHLLSLTFGARIRVKVCTDEVSPVPSACGIYSAANWFEREAWDMYGIFFSNHPDLRRILTDYGFEGFALRKDFPLSGYTEVRYDEGQKRVVSEPLELSQEFRDYDFTSPWEQIESNPKS